MAHKVTKINDRVRYVISPLGRFLQDIKTIMKPHDRVLEPHSCRRRLIEAL